jgi:hypothetical protein
VTLDGVGELLCRTMSSDDSSLGEDFSSVSSGALGGEAIVVRSPDNTVAAGFGGADSNVDQRVSGDFPAFVLFAEPARRSDLQLLHAGQ